MIEKRLNPNIVKRIYIGLLLLISVITFYFLGTVVSNRSCSINKINEVHFERDRQGALSEPTFQTLLAYKLKDTLKTVKQPYTMEGINSAINGVEKVTNLKNFITLIAVDSLRYKIIVDNDSKKDNQGSLMLLTNDSLYYLKPLRIIKDL